MVENTLRYMSLTQKFKGAGGRPKGCVKTGGRKKGTPNKRKTMESNLLVIAESGKETPLEFMTKIMHSKKLPLTFRAHVAEKAAPYVHAKLSKVELADPGGGSFAAAFATAMVSAMEKLNK